MRLIYYLFLIRLLLKFIDEAVDASTRVPLSTHPIDSFDNVWTRVQSTVVSDAS